jgi:hypothetical protein
MTYPNDPTQSHASRRNVLTGGLGMAAATEPATQILQPLPATTTAETEAAP